MDAMKAIKCIVVRKEDRVDLSSMREPGMTFSEVIEGLIEREKKQRVAEDIRRIRETEELVKIPL